MESVFTLSTLSRNSLVRHLPDGSCPSDRSSMIPIRPPRFQHFRERSSAFCRSFGLSVARFTGPRTRNRPSGRSPGVPQLSPALPNGIRVLQGLGNRHEVTRRWSLLADRHWRFLCVGHRRGKENKPRHKNQGWISASCRPWRASPSGSIFLPFLPTFPSYRTSSRHHTKASCPIQAETAFCRCGSRRSDRFIVTMLAFNHGNDDPLPFWRSTERGRGRFQ